MGAEVRFIHRQTHRVKDGVTDSCALGKVAAYQTVFYFLRSKRLSLRLLFFFFSFFLFGQGDGERGYNFFFSDNMVKWSVSTGR